MGKRMAVPIYGYGLYRHSFHSESFDYMNNISASETAHTFSVSHFISYAKNAMMMMMLANWTSRLDWLSRFIIVFNQTTPDVVSPSLTGVQDTSRRAAELAPPSKAQGRKQQSPGPCRVRRVRRVHQRPWSSSVSFYF
ncbi:hypothetical protein OUZ56_030967 [Daphnia magna]|uniref:Uncharacterized protein n=1 Tax=Daphnia magna TaxID=35525 RepID=A0ABQ9ZSV1_9CRUS|nr:hypothetical protein OUZ56_030967 [Daphnia magna]